MKNLEIEKSILSMLFVDSDLLVEYPVRDEDFTTPTHKKLFELIKTLGANFAIIQERFQDEEKEYITSLVALSIGTWRWKSDYTELKKLTEYRRIAAIAKGLLIAIEDHQELELLYEKIQKFDTGEMVETDIPQVLQDIVAEITGTKQSVLYPTGYTNLDYYLGGFTPGQLNIIAARPSVGKTLFSMCMVLKQVDYGTKCAFFSLEMSNKEIVQRILARNSWMPVRAMKNKANEEQLERVEEAMKKFDTQTPKLVLVDNVFTISELLRSIKLLHKKNQIQVVYIDYLGLIQGKGENRNLEIARITRSLKMLAMQLGIVIILLSQLNRALENRPDRAPRLSDLRDSGAIEQDADCVVMLDRDLECEPKKLLVYVRKNRNWSLGECELACEPASMQVGNLAPKPF